MREGGRKVVYQSHLLHSSYESSSEYVKIWIEVVNASICHAFQADAITAQQILIPILGTSSFLFFTLFYPETDRPSFTQCFSLRRFEQSGEDQHNWYSLSFIRTHTYLHISHTHSFLYHALTDSLTHTY